MPNTSSRDAMADFFRSRGYDCLPSDDTPGERKKPLCGYKQYWETPAPADLMTRFPSRNLQVIAGRAKGLLVIDLDGAAAIEWWNRHPKPKPRTWVTHSGGGGQHWWFRIAKDYSKPLPRAVLWTDGGAHSAVERLCDKSLVMAPPSVHPRTGRVYKFLDPAHSYRKLAMPAEVPGWLLGMPDVTPKPVPVAVPFVAPDSYRGPVPEGQYRAADVTAAIPDIRGLVESWGVRFSADVDREWMPCHAIGREDHHPSAAVSRRTGGYVDKGSGLRLGLFDLAATLGYAPDWQSAVAILGERYRARRVGGAA